MSTLLTDSERLRLQKEREAKLKELQTKKELLDRLRAHLAPSATAEPGESAENVKDARTLLQEAMLMAQRAAETATSVQSQTAEELALEPDEITRPTEPAPPAVPIAPIQQEEYKFEQSTQTEATEAPPPADEKIAAPEVVVNRATVTPAGDVVATAAPAEETDPQVPVPTPAFGYVSAASLIEAVEESHSPDSIEIKELPSEQQKEILRSPIFVTFIKRSTLIMEKALDIDKIVNIFRDPIGSSASTAETEAAEQSIDSVSTYENAKLSSMRPVTAIRTFTRHPHLFAAAYGRRREASVLDVDGAVLVWSLENNSRPENAFICQSPVTALALSSASPNVIFGGTASGSVVLWDMRASSRPAQRTKLTSTSHQTQMQRLFVIGSSSSAVLLSVDNESRICLWSIAMSLTHTTTVDLRPKAHDGQETTPSGRKFVTYAADLKNNLLIGGLEDGHIYDCTVSPSDVGAPCLYEPREAMDPRWHSAPITGLHAKPQTARGLIGGSDMLLTSSIDWTVRLWDKNTSGRYIPIHTFEHGTDYIFDVKWSPSHGAVFASVNGGGDLNLFDLNTSWHVPVAKKNLGKDVALSKIEWALEGKRFLVGSSTGQIFSAAVAPDLVSIREGSSSNIFTLNVEQARTKAEAPSSTFTF